MSALNTDKLRKGYFGSSTTLSAAIGSNDTTIPIADTTGWPTDTAIDITVDRVDANGNKTPSARETITVVISGTNGTQAIRGVEGNQQSHAAGAVVEITFTAATHNSSIDWGLQEHNQDGTHKNINATSVTATTGTFTNLTITGSNSTAGWSPVGQTLTYAGNNGNKEYLINTSVDLTGTFSKGMKVSVQRGTTPPTQCMSFTAASSQYATKASPTGITFTSAFTCEAWVYPTSYGSMGIVSRWDGTNGFLLYLNSGGQLSAQVGSGTSANAYQSIALNRWSHVAATFSAGTWKLYLNGIAIPFSTAGSATSLTQSGNLQVGAYNTSNYFNGYISEARVWSVAQSQANIQANMAISLTGSETNLVALFQGNGNFNDKTSNGNNLTATNGAIATQAANPYNAVEYGIITKVTSSQLTVFTGTDCNIPNMTLSSPQYSGSRAPYGFPASKDKWIVDSLYRVDTMQSSASQNTWYNPNTQLNVPTGDWTGLIEGAQFCSNSSAAPDVFSTLSTSNNGETNPDFTVYQQWPGSNVSWGLPFAKIRPLGTLSSATIYYLNTKTNQSGSPQIGWQGSTAMTVIQASLAYA